MLSCRTLLLSLQPFLLLPDSLLTATAVRVPTNDINSDDIFNTHVEFAQDIKGHDNAPSTNNRQPSVQGWTRAILDDMARFWGRSDGFPEDYYEALIECMGQWNEPVLEAQEVSYQVLYDMWVTGGNEPDLVWQDKSNTFLEGRQNKSGLYGGNGPWTSVPYRVVERCNYVSNTAYYNAALRVCQRSRKGQWHMSAALQSMMMKNFVTTAMSSAGFHASFAGTFFRWDAFMGRIDAYSAYRIAVQSIDTTSSIFLRFDGNADATVTDAVAVTDNITFFPLVENLPITEWKRHMDGIFTVDELQSILCILSFGCAVGLPFFICSSFLGKIAPLLLDEEKQSFFVEQYLPELKRISKEEGFPIAPWKGLPLVIQGITTSLSLLRALSFQENRLPLPKREGTSFNTTLLGAWKSPYLDMLANFLTGIPNDVTSKYDPKTKEEYPGASFCNIDSSHALWHQLVADAVFDMTVVADRIDHTLHQRKKRRLQQRDYLERQDHRYLRQQPKRSSWAASLTEVLWELPSTVKSWLYD